MIFRKSQTVESEEIRNLDGAVLPDALLRIFELLEDDVLVIDTEDSPIFQSPGISTLNILKDSRLDGDEILAIVRAVRRTRAPHQGLIEIPRGPFGKGKRKIKIAVTSLDEDSILILINDESEKARVDAIRRDFIANISHELKTPIGALSLLSEAISQAKDDPEAMERFANRIKSEAKRLEDLVREIINLSRLQGEDPLTDPHPIEMGAVVNEAIAQAETNAESRQITVERGDKHEAWVLGDRQQLIMAVHNLVENAINYSPEGTRVSVELKSVGDVIEVDVVDQGIGIKETDLERIFERFYRVDPARSRETGGTGLGLSIVKHVAQNHGGEVKVWSKIGVGSTFALRLPSVDPASIESGERS
ncbi:MAG: histidine kinase [Actinobacteria bacterium]|jgi:two-component system sensor histidine kinase SenX3|uniref:histidine kinase n=1 Tax=freshwater metagenome TaxID=449393 RepID=A0A6J6DND6_9ZZZZ|nr:histidine kinase [Actinomycetota bacterium]